MHERMEMTTYWPDAARPRPLLHNRQRGEELPIDPLDLFGRGLPLRDVGRCRLLLADGTRQRGRVVGTRPGRDEGVHGPLDRGDGLLGLGL